LKPLELAGKYMDSFFGAAPLDDMEKILAADLEFSGPFFSFFSGDEYLNSLRDDPPRDASYKILNQFENGNSACLIYEFRKPGVRSIMAQRFEIENDSIKRILLIFNARDFD